MALIDKYKQQIEKEAIDFLKNSLFANNPDNCPGFLSLQITKENKKQNLESYEKEIEIFKTLFHSDSKNHKIALWNGLLICGKSKFYKRDFSSEEYDFLNSAVIASKNPIYSVNINNVIKTERLILRAINKDDTKLFAYHFKYDGDFIIFSECAPTKKNIKLLASRKLPTFFTIEEQATHKVIGYIGLSIYDSSATGLIEYYIFKEYRKNGYCKEAIKCLVNKALNHKLYEPVETLREYIYKKKVIKLNAIRARISAINVASIETVKSCGFIHEATVHKTMHISNIGWTDEEIYYFPVME